MGQLATPYSSRRYIRIVVLSLVLLVPTLIVATALARTSIGVRADVDERSNVETTVARDDDSQVGMRRVKSPQSLPVNNRIDWPLVQMLTGLGILLLIMIGVPLGYRLATIERN